MSVPYTTEAVVVAIEADTADVSELGGRQRWCVAGQTYMRLAIKGGGEIIVPVRDRIGHIRVGDAAEVTVQFDEAVSS